METQYISVFALNKYIKAKMEQDVSLQNVYIKGEISNFRPHPSGHLYFTLKDEHSRINAIMFASQAKKLDFALENGMQVLVHARVSIYEPAGQYQIYIQTMQQDGIGNLYLQFENLKRQLEKEGLFDNKYKKEIPAYPRSIAVLSAKQGAAVQDVVRTIQLRFPFTKVIIFPIPVQGKNAYLEIIDVLKQVDHLGFDTIILARGGGSIEDLWNFNEEGLARTVFSCQTPIITGIGHETDFTICDFVSDYRGVTPTGAAIKATPDHKELSRHLEALKTNLYFKIKNRVEFQQEKLQRLKGSYYLTNPDHFYAQDIQKLMHLQDQLSFQFQMFDMKMYQQLYNYQVLLKQKIDHYVMIKNHENQRIISLLDSLSPLKVMSRGYALVKKDGNIVKSSLDLSKNQVIEIQFHDGVKEAQVK